MLVREEGASCLLGKREPVSCKGKGSWFFVRKAGANLGREEGAGCLLGNRGPAACYGSEEGADCLSGKRKLVACKEDEAGFFVRGEGAGFL